MAQSRDTEAVGFFVLGCNSPEEQKGWERARESRASRLEQVGENVRGESQHDTKKRGRKLGESSDYTEENTKLKVAKIEMVRFSLAVKRMDRNRIEYITETVHVTCFGNNATDRPD